MHDEALSIKTALLFPKFQTFKGFYLVGGTALALQVGHRLSVDLDFFSQQPLSTGLLVKVKRTFKDASISVTYRSPEQLDVLIDGVKVRFFQFEYPVTHLLSPYQGIHIATVLEIAAMKALAIGKRLSYKDYVDWYFLLKEKYVHLQKVIEQAKKKFGGDFNDRLFLGQLVSLEDVATQKIVFLRDAIDRQKIQKFLENTVRNYRF